MIYGRASWLGIDKTKERLDMVKNLSTTGEWDVLLAEQKAKAANGGDAATKEDLRVLARLRKKMMYKESKLSHWGSEVRKVIFFTDLPRHLARACHPSFAFSISERVGRCLFFIFAAVFNWASVVIQVLFPIAFANAVSLVVWTVYESCPD